MPDETETPDTPPRSIIASAFAMFRTAHALTFADILIEELETQGWQIVPIAPEEAD